MALTETHRVLVRWLQVKHITEVVEVMQGGRLTFEMEDTLGHQATFVCFFFFEWGVFAATAWSNNNGLKHKDLCTTQTTLPPKGLRTIVSSQECCIVQTVLHVRRLSVQNGNCCDSSSVWVDPQPAGWIREFGVPEEKCKEI